MLHLMEAELYISVNYVSQEPKNLQQWRGEDPSCALCSKPASLKHILTGCKVSLTQGRYTWHHNQVLKSLAATLEHRQTAANAKTPSASNPLSAVTFVCEGARKNQSGFVTSEYSQLRTACDWKMLVDVGQRLAFPQEIATTTVRPDVVFWPLSLRKVFIVELTVPWEDSVEEAYERKHLRYADLAAEAQQRV
ncbi:hypothetical protein QQF64_009609 [Cirrhinus molitorella]|uniref:Reverse transcriptase zinc-binding domain-containing protein n=1 Tax=Cirrhinus molitorella TaxID=172907 RepID=A0ABR3M588_9TELE